MNIDVGLNLFVALILQFVGRKTALVLLLSSAVLIPSNHALMVGPFHFYPIRILILGALLRIFIRGEYRNIRLNRIDWLIVAFVTISALAFIIRRGDVGAFINRLGFAYNALGAYFFFRVNLRDYEETNRILSVFPIILCVLAFGMMIEFTTHFNPFIYLGASDLPEITRDGGVRSFATFGHPILVGTFGATSLPLMGILLSNREYRIRGVFGIFASLAIVFFSHSSGPLLTLIAVMIGVFLWRYRTHMRAFRWFMLLFLVALQVAMKPPIWYIIGKLSEVVGGTGWHRSELINSFVKYFGEWWFLGTDRTVHWLGIPIFPGSQHVDVTNHFIRIAVDGGLLPLVVFVWLLIECFVLIGRRRKEVEGVILEGTFFYWMLGVVLLGHISAFFSVSYFDKIFVFWYFLLALIAKSTFDQNFFKIETVKD
jgi:hypothetical protein